LDLVLDRKALGALQRTADVGDHQARASALRMRDVDRTPMASDFPTIHLSATTGRKEMINELDRLMTITDLSEMLGVPIDTL
jgi:hypothetical protein